MKLHSECRCRGINGCPKEIEDGLLNEEWAKRNHDQSLATLNNRGGLTLEEALAIIQQRSFYQLDSPERAITIYTHILTGYKAAASSLASEKIRRAIELAREQLEAKLKPKYMNDVFTWKQIKDALK